MEITVFTKEEILALGGQYCCSGCQEAADNGRDTYFITLNGTQLNGEFVGRTAIVTNEWTPDSSVYVTSSDGRTESIRGSWFKVGQVRTADQVVAAGHSLNTWIRGRDPGLCGYSGRWLPLNRWDDEGGVRLVTVAGFVWRQEMFVPSPAVDLVFEHPSTAGSPSPPVAQASIEPVESIPSPQVEVRDPPIRPEILKFRDASLDEARGLITCGFELETQATEGCTYESEDLDEDRMAEDVSNAVDNDMDESVELLVTYRRRLPGFMSGMTSQKVREVLDVLGIGSANEALNKGLIDQDIYDSIRDSRYEAVYDDWDRSDYRSNGYDDLLNQVSVPQDVECGSDGSVQGFEFRTRGALDYTRFTKAADELFKMDHTIDTKCSFHIHLALPGVKHVHGAKLQRALTEYLIENQARVPATVRERWRGIRNNTYITPGVSKDKYSFVYKHSQGTWEFRCFGNVQNAEDARVCLDLAIEAMQFAYRVTTRQTQLYSEIFAFQGDWQRMCMDTLSTNTSVTEYLRLRTAA